MILKTRYVAWTSLYEFQGSRRCFIPWYDYDTMLMLSFCWNVFDILFMYSHYCLVPNEMLYLDRSHSDHADNVLRFLYVNTCVELCGSMLNCPHQFSFTSIYMFFEKSYFTSQFKSQSAVNSPSLLAFEEASCTSCMSSQVAKKHSSHPVENTRIYKNLSLWGSFWSDYIRACTSCNPCKARIEDTIHWFTLEGLIWHW